MLQIIKNLRDYALGNELCEIRRMDQGSSQWSDSGRVNAVAFEIDAKVSLGRTKKRSFFLCSPPRILEHLNKKIKIITLIH